jgi:hypothetical protein
VRAAVVVRGRGSPLAVGRLVVDSPRGVARGRYATSSRGRSRSLLLSSLVALSARPLHSILRNLDNLAAAPLLTVGALRESGVNRSKGCQHGLVQRRLVRMDGRCMLAQVVEAREGLATVAREGTLSGVLAAG